MTTNETSPAHTRLPWHIGMRTTDTKLPRGAKNRERFTLWGNVEGFQPQIATVGGQSDEENEANAAFIVQACNTHEDLVRVCGELLARVRNTDLTTADEDK